MLIEDKVEYFFDWFEEEHPRLYDICFNKDRRLYRKERSFCCVLMGIFLGFYLYYLIIMGLEFSLMTDCVICTILIASSALGCVFYHQIRAVGLLMIPLFFGQSGRSIIRTLIMTYVIAGPFYNMAFNMKEVFRSFSCSVQLGYNLSKTRFDLMLAPIKAGVQNMKNASEEFREVSERFQHVLEPLDKELENDHNDFERLKAKSDKVDDATNDTRRSDEYEEYLKKTHKGKRNLTEAEFYEESFKKKIWAKCEEQLDRAIASCKRVFRNSYDKCQKKFHWSTAWLFCWPMKASFLCHALFLLAGRNVCNPENKINAGMGQAYVKLRKSMKMLNVTRNNDSITMDTAKMQLLYEEDLGAMKLAARNMMTEIEKRKRFVQRLSRFFRRIFVLVYIKLIFDVFTYRRKFVTEIQFDNVYLTRRFSELDQDRKNHDEPTLLPLRKYERRKYALPLHCNRAKSEKGHNANKILRLFVEIAILSVVVFIDNFFYSILALVRDHFRFSFVDDVKHDLTITVRGTGVVAKMIRGFVSGFNVKQRVRTVVSTDPCLPQPMHLPLIMFLQIYGSYFLMLLMLWYEFYILRFRSVMCGFVYANHQEARIDYLYEFILSRRATSMRKIKAKVKAKYRSKNLAQQYSVDWTAPKWLIKWVPSLGPKCLICRDHETRRGPRFRVCPTSGCPFLHCKECWRDVEEICMGCTPLPMECGGSSSNEFLLLESEEDLKAGGY